MNIITFIDSIGRNIIGEQVAKSDSVLSVKNPAMINVAQAQNGQLQVQLIPLFFAEFIDASSREAGSVFLFNTASITLGEVSIDSRLIDQYSKVFLATPQTQPQPDEENVVKLFDE